jgi:2-dehydro-3-deoxyphosphogluconate aldolase / (4S)-4-hydroxy-2-oxoglutarate aldolase
MSVLTQILEHKIVAIIRGADPKHVLPIVEALHSGGIHLFEITLNSQHALALIEDLSDQFADRITIGAGTVLNAADAIRAIERGARFIISPNLDKATVETTRNKGAVSIPGAFTASEILQAFQFGGEIIKVFPAILGPGYLADLRGPLPQIPLMPTGGISLENIRSFHLAGAVAFGVGSSLVKYTENLTDQYLENIQQKARDFVLAIKPG